MTDRDTSRDTIDDALAAVTERYATDQEFRERVERQRETAQARLRETLRQLNGLDAILDTANQGLDRAAHQPEWAESAHDDIAELGLDGRGASDRPGTWASDRGLTPAPGAHDRGRLQVAGNARRLVGRTVIEVKATYRDDAWGADKYDDIELRLDNGSIVYLEALGYEVEGVGVQLRGRWRDD